MHIGLSVKRVDMRANKNSIAKKNQFKISANLLRLPTLHTHCAQFTSLWATAETFAKLCTKLACFCLSVRINR